MMRLLVNHPEQVASLSRWPEGVAVPTLRLIGVEAAIVSRKVGQLDIRDSRLERVLPIEPEAWPALRRLFLGASYSSGDGYEAGFDRILQSLEEFRRGARLTPEIWAGDAWGRPGRLRRLATTVMPARLPEFFARPLLAGLEVLELYSVGLAPKAVTALARAPFARDLRALVLGREPGANRRFDEAALRHFGPKCDLYWMS